MPSKPPMNPKWSPTMIWAIESMRALTPQSRKKVLDVYRKMKTIKARDEAIRKAKAKG